MRILSGSVGQGGANRKDDAALVQLLLNVERRNARGVALLSVDGEVGPQTIAAIQDFQRLYLKIAPDGVVETNGLTIKALTFCWCAWLRASKPGGYPPPNFPPAPSAWPSLRESIADAVQATLIDFKVYFASLLPAGGTRPAGPSPEPRGPRLRPDLEEFRPSPTPNVA